LKCPQGEGASAVHRNWLVQRHEGLKLRVRARPTYASKIAVRRVKGLKGGIWNRPISESIKGAPMAVGSLVFRPNLGAVTDRRLEHEGGQWREHASAANRGIQQTAGGQPDVPDNFSLDPKPGPARQQAIVRISRDQLRRHVRRLPVGGAGD